MKNRLKLISYIIIAALLIPNITFAASSTVITDNDAAWTMQWNWERNQEGFEYVSSEMSTENGLKLIVDTEKYNAFNSYKYPTKDNGETKCEASGEYKYYIRFDADGNPVAYDANDKTSNRVMVYHQGRNNYVAKFGVGETENTGEPIILSYDFDITTKNNSWWNSPNMSFMGFTLRHDVGGDIQIAHNGGNMNIEKNKNIQKHSISVIIAPTVTDGRYEMLGIMLDGEIIPMSGIYSTTSGKTDNDCYLSDLSFTFYLGSTESAELTNLNVVRGFDDIVLSTDFIDGSEIGSDGINISSSVPLKANTGEIKVYDCDFDGELVADPGTVVTYNNDVVNAMFTKLEGGGNYRMELTGVEDIWGNEYTDTLSVSFATPAGESGDIDDTPDEEAGGNNISVGDMVIGSSNTLYHGHGFYEASKTDGEFEVIVDNPEWWYAEENKFGENNYYYYTDKDGNKTLIGYGNDSWNKLDLEIKADENVNSGEPLVVSYDWKADNVGKVSEWGSYYMNIMGVYCFISEYASTETMLKYYENGTTVTKTVNLKATADGWHNIKVVFSPKLTDGRPQVTAVIVDGEITFYDNMYSTVNTYSDDTFVMNGITLNVAKPTEAKANNGDSIVKLRNVELKRVDGLKAEMFMPLGVQNPKEAIKLNFNYPVSDDLSGKDFTIYELDENGTETAISNKLTVSKAYDDKQVLVTVGDGGLYYDKNYKLVINKNIIVEDYISITEKEYEFSTYEYPDDLSAELARSGDTINYNISGGGDSFVIMVSTYDTDGALVGFNSITAEKEGSGSRQKARGSVEIKNAGTDKKVMVYIFTADGKMKPYRMPTEF